MNIENNIEEDLEYLSFCITKEENKKMAGLKVFVSSTCYDLSILRSQLRVFIQSLGYEPIMSDYEDVMYDPRKHTHTSCVDEVKNCDILVLIIGARFGGKAKPETLKKIDFEALKKENRKVDVLKQEANFSVTQLEVLKAVESNIPIYTFIDKRVWHDHSLYEKNKGSEIVDKIIFPSIEKQETAKYIFEFINFVRLRDNNNNIYPFEKGMDIEDILRKQWSGYFRSLLREQRDIRDEEKKMDQLANQFEDLKTAILSSISDGNNREVARGTVKYRRLFDFLFGLKKLQQVYLQSTNDSWETVLKTAGIITVLDHLEMEKEYGTRIPPRTVLVCEDRTFYEARFSKGILENFKAEWATFILLPEKSKEIIVETLGEISSAGTLIHYVDESIEAFAERIRNRRSGQREIEYVPDRNDA